MTPELISHAKIFIVDDELTNVRLLERILKRAGYTNLAMTTDPRRAMPMFTDDSPDLVLLDLHMPHIDGYELLQQIQALAGPDTFIPIIVLTADATAEAKHRALSTGAIDFLCKPFDNSEVELRIRNALRTRFLYLQLESQKRLLEERVKERTQMLEKAITELRPGHVTINA